MTYGEFLADFKTEIATAFKECEIPRWERRFIIGSLGKRIGQRSLDGADILSMFYDVCQSFSPETINNDEQLRMRLDHAEETYIDPFQEQLIEDEPEITFDSIGERGAILK